MQYPMKEYNHQSDWFYEGQVSSKLVQYLKNSGYKIEKDNSKNIKAKGEDIIAISPEGLKEIIEVKGYPTEFHTKGPNKGQPKTTKSYLQAQHWFSEIILSSIYNYAKHKGSKSISLALALPKMKKYSDLIKKVEDYFTDHNINFKVYLIDEDENVKIDNLNIPQRLDK